MVVSPSFKPRNVLDTLRSMLGLLFFAKRWVSLSPSRVPSAHLDLDLDPECDLFSLRGVTWTSNLLAFVKTSTAGKQTPKSSM